MVALVVVKTQRVVVIKYLQTVATLKHGTYRGVPVITEAPAPLPA